MTIQEAFRTNLIKRQSVKNWTNADLSRKSGISHTHITAIKNGNRTPNLYTAYIIAKALSCTVNDMLEGCDE